MMNNMVRLTLLLLMALLPAFVQAGGKAELDTTLEKTGIYCEKLYHAAVHFICHETVVEIMDIREFGKKYKELGHELRKTKKRNKYVTEYQLLKEGDKITEQRKTKFKNGIPVKNPDAAMKSFIRSFKSSLSPYYLFARENRDNYVYKILRREPVENQPAMVMEIRLKQKNGNHPLFALVWIATDSFAILKMHAFPTSIQGYEFLKAAEDLNVSDVEVEDIHYYGIEKNGIRFPSKTEISLRYTFDAPVNPDQPLHTTSGSRRLKRIHTIFEYKEYQFFKVVVEKPVYH